MGTKNRSYLEGRLKLLESGGKVIKAKRSVISNASIWNTLE
jgi:hypothetical protein